MRSYGRVICFAFCIALLAGTSANAGEVAHLALDGDLLDPVGGNDGSVVGGGAVDFVEGHDGTEGGAVRFVDGDGTLVRLAHTTGLPLNTQPAFSVAMWVRGPVQRDKRIFSEGSTTNNTPLFNLGTHNTGANGAFDAFIRPASPTRHVYSTTMVFDDTWHHIAWVDTNGQVTLYVDGVADGTDFSYARQARPTDTTTIGGILRSSVCCEFTGDIDDVHLYDHALSVAEVRELAGIESDDSPLADSNADWSTDGTQGVNGWTYGYYNLTDDADGAYSADEFVAFETATHWRGTFWRLAPSNAPWTTLGNSTSAEFVHPNGANNQAEHWAIRRWTSDFDGPVAITSHLRAQNTGGSGTTIIVFVNGEEVDRAAVAGNDTVGATRLSCVTLAAGDTVDLALTPVGPSGDTADGADGSYNSMVITDYFPDSDADGTNDCEDNCINDANVDQADEDGDGIGDACDNCPSEANDDQADGDLNGIGDACDAEVYADSRDDWSTDGTQGAGGWYNGYYNLTADADDTYSADEFIEFGPEHWRGANWRLAPGGAPWTFVAQEGVHPNGTNSAPNQEHWVIRRWVSDLSEGVNVTWHTRETNLGGTGVSGMLYHNGVEIDSEVIAGGDGVGVTRTVAVNLSVGDVLDLALSPTGPNENRHDGSDGSGNWLRISQDPDWAPELEIAHWAFDGDLLDSVGGNDGVMLGADPAGFATGVDCEESASVVLNGTDTMVSATHADGLPISTHTRFSISMWVRGPAGQRDMRIFSEGSTTSNRPLFNLGTHNQGANGALDAYIRDDNNRALLGHTYSTTMVFDDTWHHIVWSDNNGQVVLYVDGVADATDFSYTRGPLDANTTTIGGILRANPSHWWTGEIDEVRLFNYVLDQSDVDAIYSEVPEGCGPPSFALEFSGASDQAGCAGDTSSASVDCVLVTSDNFSGEGAQSHSFGVSAQGGTITAISTDGSDAAALLSGGFEINELTSGAGNEGAISAMILSFEQNTMLPANGSASLATVTVESAISEGGSVELSFVNGLSGSGLPISCVATWQGNTYRPTLGRVSYSLSADSAAPAAPGGLGADAGDATVALDWDDSGDAVSYSLYRNGELLAGDLADSAYTDDSVENGAVYAYAVTATDSCGNESDRSSAVEASPEAPANAVRGDSNGDLEVNISDPTYTLQWLFLGGAAPSCEAAADSNGDGDINISDPTYTLLHLFLGGPAHPALDNCDL